jgi:hypothetical protein
MRSKLGTPGVLLYAFDLIALNRDDCVSDKNNRQLKFAGSTLIDASWGPYDLTSQNV